MRTGQGPKESKGTMLAPVSAQWQLAINLLLLTFCFLDPSLLHPNRNSYAAIANMNFSPDNDDLEQSETTLKATILCEFVQPTASLHI
jgi:hypothetical protein